MISLLSQPDILDTARYLVDFPRREYSTDFAVFVAGDVEEQEAYASGLVVLGCILASIYVIWWMVLLVLKCKGKSVGCASGRSFRGERVRLQDEIDASGSTDVEEEWTSGAENSGDRYDISEEASFQSSIKSSENDGQSEVSGSSSEYSAVSRPTTRERRTQIAFFVCGLMSLAAVPFVLTLSFSPLKEAVESTENFLLSSRTILSQVENALNSINIGIGTAADLVDSVPSTAAELCPFRSFEEIQELYDIDLRYITSEITDEYESVRASIIEKFADVTSNTVGFGEVLSKLEKAHRETEAYLWAIPGLMLAMSSLTASLLFGVILAWKRQSNRQAQRILSYGVLPCLIGLSMICWIVGIVSAIFVAMFSDACTQGEISGTPSVVVDSIIALKGFEQNSTTYNIVKAFTSGCGTESNPTATIEAVEKDVSRLIEDIGYYIASIDSAGREDLMNICGSDSLNTLVEESNEIAKLLSSVRRAVGVVADSLKCEEIHPIYAGAVEEAACKDLAVSFSWSMFMFLSLGVTTMCMVSLRASWRHKVGEEQIYNEDEVAENMFLDEHEEYLYYISKYKHEWEEYAGINSMVPLPPGARQSLYDEASQSAETNGSRTDVGGEAEDGDFAEEEDDDDQMQTNYIANYDPHQEAFNPYQTTVPASPSTDGSEDISFLSLRTLQIKTPQSTGGDDSDVESENRVVEEKDEDAKLTSSLGLLTTAMGRYSSIFRGQPNRAGGDMTGKPVSEESHIVARTATRDSAVSGLPHASSDLAQDDKSQLSHTKLRVTTSEGGGFSKKGWRSRTNIALYDAGTEWSASGDIIAKRATTAKTKLRESDLVDESPKSTSQSIKSEYSL